MTPEERAASSQRRVDATRAMTPDKFAVWKHYEERANRLGEQLWSMGAWLIALVGATLSLPFVGGLVKHLPSQPHLQIENWAVVAIIALFGILLCGYSFIVLGDLREHIESNWRKAGYVLEDSWEANWEGRENHGWRVLQFIGALAFLGFLALLILAIAGYGRPNPSIERALPPACCLQLTAHVKLSTCIGRQLHT